MRTEPLLISRPASRQLSDCSAFLRSLAPYSEDTLQRLYADYQILPGERENCAAFFQSIPSLLMQDFGNILHMINHFLGGSEDLDYSVIPEGPTGGQIHSRSIVSTYEQKYLYETNDSLLFEKILTEIIERGQVEKIAELESDFFSFSKGTLANNPLRNLKNLTISSITLFSRAAIRAGIDSQLALKMSDLYIMNTEQCRSADEVADQVIGALTAYTTEVARLRHSLEKESGFGGIIRYVREHTHYPLSVAHIAAEFGYNTDYLSRAFKQEYGFNLSTFIMRTKLEESKELLRHTNRSILEISEYLCFSSQNYFQTAFKKQYGITPLVWRKSSRS